MFIRGTKVSLGDIWSNDISQVSRGLMDYNFVAQKNNFIDNSFFKVNYGKNELKKMVNDEVMRSQLINQMWLIREYNNFHKGALNRINKIDSLIRVEINQ